MSNYLLTEAGDTLITERGNSIAYDFFEVCAWPDLAEIKTFIGITVTTYDAFLQRHIYAVTESIESYLDRSIPMAVQTDIIRPIESDKSFGYASQVQLKRWPILEVIEIHGDDELLSVDSTIQYGGILSAELNAYDKVTVKYHGGLCPVPYELEDVFYELMKARYEGISDSSVDQELKKRTIPNVITEEFFAPDLMDPSYVGSYARILDKYRTLYV